MQLAPVALFIYKRPEHVRRAIKALMACPEFPGSPIYVFCDGPKSEAETREVEETRVIAHELLGSRAAMVESDVNHGLAASIIAGVSALCKQFGRVIVVEDDLLVSPAFLAFMNTALDRYARDDRVMQISGYMYPVPDVRECREALFLPFTCSWGWATWEKSWRYFDPLAEGSEALDQDATLRYRFDINKAFEYSRMLRLQKRGEIDSWAICWYWSVFRRNGLALFPPRSYVRNIGFDGSGTHGWRTGKNSMSTLYWKRASYPDCRIS